MTDVNTTTTSDDCPSAADIAIINAAFKLYEIAIVHRSYKRSRRGKYPFTRGAFEQAKKALSGLLPPAPGADAVRVVAHFAKHPAVAKASIMAAIEQLTKSKKQEWDSIRDIELSDYDLKTLSDNSPIFQRYRSVTTLDRAIKELSQPGIASKMADAVLTLVSRVGQTNSAAKVAA